MTPFTSPAVFRDSRHACSPVAGYCREHCLQAACQFAPLFAQEHLIPMKQRFALDSGFLFAPAYVNRLSAEIDTLATARGQLLDSMRVSACRRTTTARLVVTGPAPSHGSRCKAAGALSLSPKFHITRAPESSLYSAARQVPGCARNDLHGFVMLLTECGEAPVHHWSRLAASLRAACRRTGGAGRLQHSRSDRRSASRDGCRKEDVP